MVGKKPKLATGKEEPTAPVPREHFIPIRQSDLIDRLGSQLQGLQKGPFDEFSRLLAATFHYEFHLQMSKLKNAYATLDPDRDTLVISDAQLSLRCSDRVDVTTEFFDSAVKLLERANFSRLSQADIEATTHAASDWGVNLQVDFELFDRLEVYARGDGVGTKIRKRLRNLYRDEVIEVPVYQRLVVIFKLRDGTSLGACADSNRVYLKLFKGIPKIDLDMLLPGTRVKISRLDQGKIILPTLSGIVLALIKIIKGVALLASATAAGILSFLGILGGTIGYGVKSFLGYLRTKDKYQLNLTRSLYFQNLDNNAGVLCRLLDEAEEQEVREAILAWFLLWAKAPSRGWSEQELDLAAESFLEDEFSIQVDFEIDDALQKLSRLGLVRCDHLRRWTALSLEDAQTQLDGAWDNLFQSNQPPLTRRAG
ncbi:MAG: TMEM143 family protein [Mariniblastus sp.]|nr:TMEM143 family protein [Mariniblastus sp.]